MDKFLWRNSDALKFSQLWEYFSTYYYLPRLVDEEVLRKAVRKGVAAETFGLAEDFLDGKYLELEFGNAACTHISPEYLLVKASVAKEQLKIKDPPPPPPPDTVKPDDGDGKEKDPPLPPPPPPLPKYFSMNAELNRVRYSKELKKYIDEIAYHLMDLPNAKTSIRVTIDISVPDGVPQYLKEIVEEIVLTWELMRNIFTLNLESNFKKNEPSKIWKGSECRQKAPFK